jgi:hypothetical protein
MSTVAGLGVSAGFVLIEASVVVDANQNQWF